MSSHHVVHSLRLFAIHLFRFDEVSMESWVNLTPQSSCAGSVLRPSLSQSCRKSLILKKKKNYFQQKSTAHTLVMKSAMLVSVIEVWSHIKKTAGGRNKAVNKHWYMTLPKSIPEHKLQFKCSLNAQILTPENTQNPGYLTPAVCVFECQHKVSEPRVSHCLSQLLLSNNIYWLSVSFRQTRSRTKPSKPLFHRIKPGKAMTKMWHLRINFLTF